MAKLYLDLYSDIEDGQALAPVETIISIFIIRYIKADTVILKFVVKPNSSTGFLVILSGFNYEVVSDEKTSKVAITSKLPALLLEDGNTVVAGLCSVLRRILKSMASLNPSHRCHHLLGFRGACLVACAEFSLWTRFCEIDIINTVNKIYEEDGNHEEYVLPADLARFEFHMGQPVRMHNIQKKKQELAKQKDKIQSEQELQREDLEPFMHWYAEGTSMTLADIILFPCFSMIFSMLDSSSLKKHLPRTLRWFNFVKVEEGIKDSLSVISMVERKFPSEANITYILPNIPLQSLYKRDPKRYKPKNRIFTRQKDVETSIKVVKEMGISAEWHLPPFGHEMKVDWSTIPPDFHPENGEVPPSRQNRKSQQLENLAKAVLKIFQPGQTIVDFCSGCGHLGIVLAYLLPMCHIVLLENKECSLNKARERVKKLGLSNVSFFQCNLDYFIGKFDIGVALHACGVATDLVIQHCLWQNAAFVCCPCCYGSICNTHYLTYPRSLIFRESPITLNEYFVLGHSADQTHSKDDPKTEQGEFCMGVIDTDRCLLAKESGYSVSLSKMVPESCSPKNNLLVGIPNVHYK